MTELAATLKRGKNQGATPGAILSATPGATPGQPPANEGATHTPYTPSVAPALSGAVHAIQGDHMASETRKNGAAHMTDQDNQATDQIAAAMRSRGGGCLNLWGICCTPARLHHTHTPTNQHLSKRSISLLSWSFSEGFLALVDAVMYPVLARMGVGAGDCRASKPPHRSARSPRPLAFGRSLSRPFGVLHAQLGEQ